MNKLIITLVVLILTGFSIHCYSQGRIDSINIKLNELTKKTDSLKWKIDTLTINADSIKRTTQGNQEILEKNFITKDYKGQSMFEDKKGESAIFYPSGGILRFNYSDASFKFGYLNSNTANNLYFGGELSGKISDNKGTIFKSGNLSPGASLAFNFGFKEFSKSLFKDVNARRIQEDRNYLIDGWLNFEFKYNYINYEIFDPDKEINNQLIKGGFHGFSTLAKFNVKVGPSIMAISSGWQLSNNLDDFKEIELIYRNEQVDIANNRTIIYEESKKIKKGEFKEKTVVPINLDVFWYSPKQPRIGFYHFYRGQVSNNKYRSGMGTGIYLLKKGNPLNSIGGVVFELSNLQNANNENYLKDNIVVNIVIGYTFGK